MESKYSYKITPLAYEDMEQALSYIAETLHSPKASKDLFGAIMASIDNICAFPEAYSNCFEYDIYDESIRKIVVNNYIMVYEVKEELKQINILRFRYGRMDLSNLETK